MTGRKYDYSNELAQDAPQSENEERKAEARTRRLEERSTALADEFRDLKPEIGRAYNLLQKLVSQTGTFATTMLNLHDLLKNDLPIRFSEEDRKMLQDELNSIARKAAGEIRKNEKTSLNTAGGFLLHGYITDTTFRILCFGHFCQPEIDSFRHTDRTGVFVFHTHCSDSCCRCLYIL